MAPIKFEDNLPIASETEAIGMLSNKYRRDGEQGVEGFIYQDDGVLYLTTAKITGWPETVEWQKYYRLEETVFESLKAKGWIQPTSPGGWSISAEGVKNI